MREEGAYLNRYETDEQRSRRPIFNATLRTAASWLFFRVARSTVMIQIAALRLRLEKQPTDLRPYASYIRDDALDGRPAPARLDDPVPPTAKAKSDTKLANVSASTFPTQKRSGACPFTGGLKRSINFLVFASRMNSGSLPFSAAGRSRLRLGWCRCYPIGR
jgi:hypothetical protein